MPYLVRRLVQAQFFQGVALSRAQVAQDRCHEFIHRRRYPHHGCGLWLVICHEGSLPRQRTPWLPTVVGLRRLGRYSRVVHVRRVLFSGLATVAAGMALILDRLLSRGRPQVRRSAARLERQGRLV